MKGYEAFVLRVHPEGDPLAEEHCRCNARFVHQAEHFRFLERL